MDYRVATVEDAETIASIHARSWVETYRGIFSDKYLDDEVWAERSASWLERLTNPMPNQHTLVAVENGDICGFICAFGNQHPQWGTFIDNLHVASAHQRQGIGIILMRMAAEWSMQTYPDNGMYLEVLEDNHGARGFYQRLGATHHETNLWQPPGGGDKVHDLLFVWESLKEWSASCR